LGVHSWNLKAVALTMRQKYPNAEIVIVADNDAYTHRPDGTPWNPGIEKGKEAAEAIGAAVVWPEFADSSPEEKRTDANDYACLYGLDN